MGSKDRGILLSIGQPKRRCGISLLISHVGLAFFVIVILLYFPYSRWIRQLATDDQLQQVLNLSEYPLPPQKNSSFCPQPASISPSIHADLNDQLDSLYSDESFQLQAFEALGGAIRVPTESYDDLRPVGDDRRWDVFADLHSYLEKTFSTVFEQLNVTKVNTYNIVLHWQGSDDTLKPILLTAHQDVVPVEPLTVDKWEQPPYSGYYDGMWIWGRGTADDKGSLIAQLVTVDALLRNGFKPKRTVVFAYGIDEEASSLEGAGHLIVYLENRYGRDGFAIIVDEGSGFTTQEKGGIVLATPDVSEKGYLDVRVEVNTPGGHSSVPPAHTSIGILAALINEIEAHPHGVNLPRSSTPFRSMLCLATYSIAFPSELRPIAFNAATDDHALEHLRDGLVAWNPYAAALLGTTQAVDLISGGVKVNALPESAAAVVNHRIAEHSSVGELQEYLTDLLTPVATLFNLSVNAFGKAADTASENAGELILSDAWDTAIEPSPITPTQDNGPWKLLSGTIKATVHGESHGYDAVVIPSLATGNTDTRWYWNLTRHIFRYTHRDNEDMKNGAHTVNEAVRARSMITELRFFTKLILNADETTLL